MAAPMSDPYYELLKRKKVSFAPRGLKHVPALNGALFPHQLATTEFALTAGCAAAFLDTGLGKALISLEWARVICETTNKSVLILAPLAVGPQHQREAEKFGIDAKYIREPSQIDGVGIWITNYERVHKFDVRQFAGVVLDESSLIKSFTGATTRQLMETFANTPYRLACTATPAPNDHMELGQHCQFLGAMDSNEMLARWFIADQANMGKYRLKKAAVNPFWDWVASWARCISKPSDIGFDDGGFILPELVMHQHIVRSDVSIDAGEEKGGQGRMFRIPEMSATSIHKEKRLSIDMRADAIAEAVAAEPNEPWVLWCDTDYEADALMSRIGDAVEVRGSMKAEMKEERIVAFSEGKVGKIVSKASICGFGLNWQHCARMGFVGLSFSYEQFYQAVRRCWRFGQKRPVHVHVAMADTEKAIWDVVTRKAGDHDAMKINMTAAMKRAMQKHRVFEDYNPTAKLIIPNWGNA
jgi:hypothetical protein